MRLNPQSVQRLVQQLRDLEHAVNAIALETVDAGAKRIIAEINDMPWTEHPLFEHAQLSATSHAWMIPPEEPWHEYAHGAPEVGPAPDPYGKGEMPFMRTHELAESIYFASHVDDESAVATTYSDAPYAAELELGDPRYPFMWPPTEHLATEGILLNEMAQEFQSRWRTKVASLAK